MTTNQFLLIAIITAIVFLIIGVYIGHVLTKNMDSKLRNKVNKMDVSEIFKRYHGISD